VSIKKKENMGKLTFGQTGLSYEVDKVEIKVEGAPKCPRCDQSVYFNEEKKALGKTWHVRCFNCCSCKKSLSRTNYHQHNDELFCAACFKKVDTLKPCNGAAYVPGYAGLTPSVIPDDRFGLQNLSVSETTPEIWINHSDPRNGVQQHYVEVDKDVSGGYTETWVNSSSSAYSSPSQGSREDLRGGLASPARIDYRGAVTSSREELRSGMASPGRVDARGGAAYSSREDLRGSVSSPRRVATGNGGTGNIDDSSTAFLFRQGFAPVRNSCSDATSDDVYEQQKELKSAPVRENGNPMRSQLGARASARFRMSSQSVVDKDDPECCPHCGKRVYIAEEMNVKKRKWHKLCFKCSSCSKSLEPGRYNEHESALYCQTCYGKNFGPQGYGFSGGAAGHMTLSNAPGSRLSVSTAYEGRPPSISQPLSAGYSEAVYAEPVTMDVREPIRGTQEWTEAIFLR